MKKENKASPPFLLPKLRIILQPNQVLTNLSVPCSTRQADSRSLCWPHGRYKQPVDPRPFIAASNYHKMSSLCTWQLVTLTQGVLSASVLHVSEQLFAVRTPRCSPAQEKLDLCKAARRNCSAVLCTSQSIARGHLVLTLAGLLMAVSSEKLPAGQGRVPGRRRPRTDDARDHAVGQGDTSRASRGWRWYRWRNWKVKGLQLASAREAAASFGARHKLTFSREEKGREVRRKG